MQKLLALEQVSLVIRKGILIWYGHVECKDDTDWILDQMLYYNGGRGCETDGHPRMTRWDSAKEDIKSSDLSR